MTNEAGLQSWFTKRMVTFISEHGKTPIGWSEVMRGGLATNVMIMDWIGGGGKAAEAWVALESGDGGKGERASQDSELALG